MHPVDLFNAREVIDSLTEERDAYYATSMEVEREKSHLAAEVVRLKAYLEVDGDALKRKADTIAALRAELAALRGACDPFVLFIDRWDANPLRGASDAFYCIHTGVEGKEAELRLEYFRKLRDALGR